MDITGKLKKAGIRVNSEGQIHQGDIEKVEHLLQHKVLGLPQLISGKDFTLKKILDNEDSNKKMYRELTKKSTKKEILKIAPNGQLFWVGHKIFLVDNDNQRIDYYMQYEIQHIFKIKTVTQIAIWADYISQYINLPSGERVSKYVFFNILLPLTDTIVTDALQTDDGRRFWINRVTESIKAGLHVYAVFKDKNRIYKVDSLETLRKLKDDIWGDEKTYLNRKLFISTEEVLAEKQLR